MLCIIAGSTTATQAQLFNRLKDRAKDAVQDRVEEKLSQKVRQIAYKSVDRTWESVFGESTEDLEEGAAPPSLPYKLNSNVDTEDSYSFYRESEMEIINYEDGEEEKVIMKMYLSEKGNYSGTTYEGETMKEGEKTIMIYDYENNAMVMLMESEEGKFSFAYDWSQGSYSPVNMDSAGTGNPYADLESIGTKEILGYECEGYRSETDDSVTEIWVTMEEIEGLDKNIEANGSTRFLRGNPMLGYQQGTVLEMESSEKGSDRRMVMKMVDLNRKVNMDYEMEDYPVIGSE